MGDNLTALKARTTDILNLRNALQVLRVTGAGEKAREIIDRQVRHLVRLVDDLLEVSRISRGAVELRRERVELAAVVESAAEAARPQVEAAGHGLAVSLPSEPVWLDADATRTAVYTSMPLGTHSFHIRASNSDGVWDRAGRGAAGQRG